MATVKTELVAVEVAVVEILVVVTVDIYLKKV